MIANGMISRFFFFEYAEYVRFDKLFVLFFYYFFFRLLFERCFFYDIFWRCVVLNSIQKIKKVNKKQFEPIRIMWPINREAVETIFGIKFVSYFLFSFCQRKEKTRLLNLRNASLFSLTSEMSFYQKLI